MEKIDPLNIINKFVNQMLNTRNYLQTPEKLRDFVMGENNLTESITGSIASFWILNSELDYLSKHDSSPSPIRNNLTESTSPVDQDLMPVDQE